MPELVDDIDRLVSKTNYCFASVNAISESFRSHSGYATVENIFSHGINAANQLGLILSVIEDYHVGDIRALNAQELQDFLPFLSDVDLPGWKVAKRCGEIFGYDVVCDEILQNIIQKIPVGKVATVLRELSNYSSDEDNIISIYSLYLKLLHNYPKEESIGHLRSLKLLADSGGWRPSTELCDGVIEISEQYVLDREFSEILGNLIVQTGSRDDHVSQTKGDNTAFDLMVDRAPDDLTHYFSDWESLVRPATVGAFVALFGTCMRQLAEKWLQPHSIDWLYDQVGWQIPGPRTHENDGWMHGKTALEAFGLLRVCIRQIQGDLIDVPNLYGDPISVPLSTDIRNLVAGGFYWKGGYDVEVRIRQIPDLRERSTSELSEILKNSATYVLQEAYAQKMPDLTGLWKQLEESDQLELSVARATILYNLPMVLRQIGAHKKSPDLAKALGQYDKALRAKIEVEQSKKKYQSSAFKASEKDLADLLVQREDVQAGVLEAVRDKLRDYQYDPSGILFELFQNADDATIELQALDQELRDKSLPDDASAMFVVVIGPSVIWAIHWGRPINYCPPTIDDIRAEDFRRDLEKMLILSASDKNPSAKNPSFRVTGKFGLGFKSVLLATDSPRILSGDLRFEIVGGVLPQPWNIPSETESVLSKYSSNTRRRTVTEIPIKDEALFDKVIKRFSDLSGLQAVFSRLIREIKIVGVSRLVPRGRWKDKTIIGPFETGFCDLPTATGLSVARLLVYRGSDEVGCVAIQLGSRGAERFDGCIPPFWVTAPTRESESIGFVVNAGLEVDAGRSRLASNSKHNIDVVEKLGIEFGSALSHLFLDGEGEKDWDSIRKQLDLAVDVSHSDFWATIWRSIQQRRDINEAEAHKLAHIIVNEALGVLTKKTRRVPNGIPGELAGFVSATLPIWAFSEVWRSDVVLSGLANWEPFQKRYPKSQWISDDLAAVASECCSKDIQKVAVKNLTTCIDDSRCDAAAATCLNKITPKLREKLSWNELTELKSFFSSLRFLSQAGSWSSASSLVSKDSEDPDERLIAKFAPKNYLLSGGDYIDGSFAFFTQCRGDRGLLLSVTDITQFFLQATEVATRQAALKYLGQGKHARDVSTKLRPLMPGTWLENSYDYLPTDCDSKTKLEISLHLHPESISYQSPVIPEIDEIPLVTGDKALVRIAKWWESEGREQHLSRYQQQFWPANVSRDFDADPIDRRAWMTLFGLGLTQRMGRVRDSQNRGFIESLDSKGWWDIFCTVKPQDDPYPWFKVLDEYGAQQVDNEEFGLWMDNFARLYRVAKWLGMYAHVFKTIDQRAGNQFGPLLNPGSDPIFQGDDEASAPSLERSLKNGQYLVIRELLRTGVLHSTQAQQRAYIPSWSVRQFFVSLNFDNPWPSEKIYEFLANAIEDPTFGGDYDIPIRIISHNEELRRQILKV